MAKQEGESKQPEASLVDSVLLWKDSHNMESKTSLFPSDPESCTASFGASQPPSSMQTTLSLKSTKSYGLRHLGWNTPKPPTSLVSNVLSLHDKRTEPDTSLFPCYPGSYAVSYGAAQLPSSAQTTLGLKTIESRGLRHLASNGWNSFPVGESNQDIGISQAMGDQASKIEHYPTNPILQQGSDGFPYHSQVLTQSNPISERRFYEKDSTTRAVSNLIQESLQSSVSRSQTTSNVDVLQQYLFQEQNREPGHSSCLTEEELVELMLETGRMNGTDLGK